MDSGTALLIGGSHTAALIVNFQLSTFHYSIAHAVRRPGEFDMSDPDLGAGHPRGDLGRGVGFRGDSGQTPGLLRAEDSIL